MNYLNLSFTDLLKIPAFALAARLDDKECMKRILWEAGMDVEQPYEIIWTNHRALTTNIPQENYLVMGLGRTDKEHLNGKFKRLEDVIAAAKDPSLRDELISLDSRAASFDEERELSEDIDLDMLDELEALGTSEGDFT